MADPLSGVKKVVSGLKSRYAAGTKQSEQLGTELGEARKMKELGKQALEPSKPAAAPAPPVRKPSSKELVSPGAKYGDRPPEERIDVGGMIKPLGSLKKGGKVQKTGMYQLHAGEKVIPSGKKSAAALGAGKSKAKKGSGKKPHKMIIRHNDDSTFSVTHQHQTDAQTGIAPKDEEFTTPNVKRLKQHVGMTFAPEAEPEPMTGGQ